jgi:hypothetical protein
MVAAPVLHHQKLAVDREAFLLEEDIGDGLRVDFEADIFLGGIDLEGASFRRLYAHLKGDGVSCGCGGKDGLSVGGGGGRVRSRPPRRHSGCSVRQRLVPGL